MNKFLYSTIIILLISFLPQKAIATAQVGGNDRFKVYDDGTIADSQTKLMWSQKDNGEDINWTDASQFCESFTGGGHEDWRLPTRKELASLLDPNSSERYKIFEYFKLSACCPWTADIRTSEARSIFFMTGDSMWYTKTLSKGFRALPVRTIK